MSAREQRVVEIASPMERARKTADTINREIANGWRVESMTEVRALSPVNLQPITSSIVVLLSRPARPPVSEVTEMDDDITALGLSSRAANALNRAGIESIAGLCARTDAELLRLDGFGRLCLNQTIDALACLGLRLATKEGK